MRENPPVKVVGGLGRPFGGSGLSMIPARGPQTQFSMNIEG